MISILPENQNVYSNHDNHEKLSNLKILKVEPEIIKQNLTWHDPVGPFLYLFQDRDNEVSVF